MTSRNILVIVVVMFVGIETFFLHVVGGFTSVIDTIAVATFAIPALYAGQDLCRFLGEQLFRMFPRLGRREIRGVLLLAMYVFLIGVPMGWILWLASVIAPGHVGTVVDMETAWKIAGGMSIIHGFFCLNNAPGSFRAIYARYRESRRHDLY